MTTKIDGITSGLDTTALINAILTSYSLPRSAAADSKAAATAQRAQYDQLKTLVDNLHDSLEAMTSASSFSDATTSTSSFFAVKAAAGTVAGTHTMSVDSLAAATVLSSGSFGSTSASGTIATGTYRVTVGS